MTGQPATENKIVLIVRKTRLDELVRRFNTEEQARFYVEHLGADFADYREEDRHYKAAVRSAAGTLSQLGRLQVVDRSFVPNFIFGREDRIVALGQDGLVANILKYLDGQPVIGVNPDPARWDGALLPFKVGELRAVIQDLFKGRRKLRRVTMAEARLNTGQILRGVNDIFVGAKTHVSARYRIEIAGQGENHSSSGIIVSTGLGSSGWLRSVLTGAMGIASHVAGQPMPAPQKAQLAWDEEALVFSIREPWPSTNSSAKVTFGRITAGSELRLTSQMAENGVIFSDGIEQDYLEFNSGAQASIGVAERKGSLVV